MPTHDAFAGTAIEYEVRAQQPRDGYTVGVRDPLPCRTNTSAAASGTRYSSLASGTCTQPLVAVTAVRLSSAVAAAGWVPQARLVDGTLVALTGSGTNWTVPAAAAGKVAELVFPEAALASDVDFRSYTVLGTLAANLVAGDEVYNTAWATFTSPAGTQPAVSSTNYHLIRSEAQLWASKSLDGGNYIDGYSVIAGGTLRTAVAPTADIVITDLLPLNHQFDGTKSADVLVYANGQFESASSFIELVDDFEGTGRQLVRATVTADDLAALAGATYPQDFDVTLRFSARPLGPGEFTNTSQIFYTDAAAADCLYDSRTFADATDWDENPATTRACEQSSSLMLYANPTASGFTVDKFVQGDLDEGFVAPPAVGQVSIADGYAWYQLAVVNLGADPLNHPVAYDVLPHVGDTGSTTLTAGTPRGSEFDVLFVGVDSVPAGVRVSYSTASNPCRPEIMPSNPGCVDDWTSIEPDDPTTVTALRFASDATFDAGEGFRVSYGVAVPEAPAGQTAWNTGAVAALEGDVRLPAYESIPVGIRAVADEFGTFELTKRVDKPTALPGDVLTYTLTLANTGREAGFGLVVDMLPEGVTLIDATGDYVTLEGPPVGSLGLLWSFEEVPAGGEVSVTVTVRVDDDAALGSTVTNYSAAIGSGDVTLGNPCPEELNEAIGLAGSCASTELVEDQPTPSPTPTPTVTPTPEPSPSATPSPGLPPVKPGLPDSGN